MENIKFTCSICNRTFTRKCSLSYHLSHNNHSFSNCLSCGKQISSNKKFCNRSCSASYNNKLRKVSDEQKLKTSKSLISFYEKRQIKKIQKTQKKPKLILKCKSCGKEIRKNSKTGFCQNCLRYSNNVECVEYRRTISLKGGKSSAKSQINRKRSKNEIFFAELINLIYKDSINNMAIFNGWDADIIIPSMKIAILWNGVWHYEDICGQLKQVQNRDKIKYFEIVKAGYMPYIIVDLGKFSKKKCFKELERFNNFIESLN